jgi:hypothetical protein
MLLWEVLKLFLSNDPWFKFNFKKYHWNYVQSGQYRADCPWVRGGWFAGSWLKQIEESQISLGRNIERRTVCRWKKKSTRKLGYSDCVELLTGGRSAWGDRMVRTCGICVGPNQPWLIFSHISFLPTKPSTTLKALSFSLARGKEPPLGEGIWRGSRTVRAHPRTLREFLHHVLFVFHWFPISCSWISSMEMLRVWGCDLFFGHVLVKLVGGTSF